METYTGIRLRVSFMADTWDSNPVGADDDEDDEKLYVCGTARQTVVFLFVFFHEHTNNSLVSHLSFGGGADVGLSIMAPCCQRHLRHDFTEVIYPRVHAVAFRQTNLARDVFGRQFTARLWVALLLCSLGLVLAMSSAHLLLRGNNRRRQSAEFGPSDSLEWMFCKLQSPQDSTV